MKRASWEIVAGNSLIQFKIKYLHISTIAGKLAKFSGEVIADDLFARPEVYLLLNGSSIETSDRRCSLAIRSGKWLIADPQPFFEFRAMQGCQHSSGKIRELTGELQINNIRKSITFVVSHADIRESRKKMTAVFHLFGAISRRDFDLFFLEEDDFDDEVLINAEIALVKKIVL